jgi:7,8-dihydropterin-6-yl-methyl-4-(beta-D-ribofuranosyl)aminobenzene 5'-phosphate synthase
VKLTVLVDNNTLIDRYFLAEPGVSYVIELDGLKILFDTGCSDVFMKNAAKMGIDLFDIDVLVLSHAHVDHTWGLHHLFQAHAERQFEGRPVKRPVLVAHPSVFRRRLLPGVGDIGCLVSEEIARRYVDLQLTDRPHWLHPDLVFLGEVERQNDFEAGTPIGHIRQDDSETEDWILDDSSLAYRSPQGLVIIAGCAHAGICNTVSQAMHTCGETRLADIIGGFHLQQPSERQLRRTVEQLSAWHPRQLHACHCTDLKSRIALSAVADLEEVGVGLQLIY